MLRVADVARRLDVSVATVYALVAAGKLRHHRIGVGRGCIRVDEQQLAEYLLSSSEVRTPARKAPEESGFKHVHL